MARLTAAARKKVTKFAGPNKTYPDEDIVHARKAVQMAPHAGAGAAAIRAKVHRDWPSIKIGNADKPSRRTD